MNAVKIKVIQIQNHMQNVINLSVLESADDAATELAKLPAGYDEQRAEFQRAAEAPVKNQVDFIGKKIHYAFGELGTPHACEAWLKVAMVALVTANGGKIEKIEEMIIDPEALKFLHSGNSVSGLDPAVTKTITTLQTQVSTLRVAMMEQEKVNKQLTKELDEKKAAFIELERTSEEEIEQAKKGNTKCIAANLLHLQEGLKHLQMIKNMLLCLCAAVGSTGSPEMWAQIGESMDATIVEFLTANHMPLPTVASVAKTQPKVARPVAVQQTVTV